MGAPPKTSDREIFADISGKKEARKKGKRGENCEEKKENWKMEGGKLEMEVGKVIESGEDLFFFPLFTFENDGNLFWVYQNGNFLPGKNISRQEKKSGKMTLPPQKNMPVMPLFTMGIPNNQ